MRSGSAFVRLALGFARVGCAEWVPGGLLPDAARRTQGAGRRAQGAVKPGIHGVGTQWIRGFMAFQGPALGAGAGSRGAGAGVGELGVAGTG